MRWRSPDRNLALIGIFGYWPISFLVHPLKWDMIDTVLPWRYYMGEALRAGYFPFWNPFQQSGYPIHADVRSVWNPEALLSSCLFGPDLRALHFILIGYFILAGWGMRRLLLRLGRPPLIAFFVSAAYMFSGYMLGQAQDMPRIAAAALLPWSVWAWWGMRNAPGDFRKALVFSLVMYLQLTAGYQAIAIILQYLFLLLFIEHIIRLWRQNSRSEIRSFVFSHLIAYTGLVSLSMPLLYSVWQSADHVGRFAEGVSTSQALNYPFSPQSFLSFISPWATTVDSDWFQTDVSMRNGFVGILGLILAISGLRNWRALDGSLRLLIIFGTLCILPALGHFTPVRMWLYDHIPLFNLFKTPAYFILFFLFGLFILAAHARFQLNKLILVIGGMMIISLLLLPLIDWGPGKWNAEEVHIAMGARSWWQLLFATLILIIAFRITKPQWLLTLWVVEVVLAAQLQIPNTAVNDTSFKQKQDYLHHLPRGFSLQPQGTLSDQTENRLAFQDIYRNNGVFQKRLSPGGFNSFYFDALNSLEADSAVYKSIMMQEVAYFPSRIVADGSSASLDGAAWSSGSLAPISYADSGQHALRLMEITPNSFRFHTRSAQARPMAFTQSYYPGWTASIDGVEAPLIHLNCLFMGVQVPAGEHLVTFHYSNHMLEILMMIAASLFLLFIVLVLRKRGLRTYGIPLLAGGLLLTLLSQWSYAKRNATADHFFSAVRAESSDISCLGISEDIRRRNASMSAPKGFIMNDTLWHQSFLEWYDQLQTFPSDTLLFFQDSERHRSALWSLVSEMYPNIIAEDRLGRRRWRKAWRDGAPANDWQSIAPTDDEFIMLKENRVVAEASILVFDWDADSLLHESLRMVVEIPEKEVWYGLPPSSGSINMELPTKEAVDVRVYIWNPERIALDGMRYRLLEY